MNKFNLSITAHTEKDIMLLYEKEFEWNITNDMKELPIRSMIQHLMPCIKWKIDDGKDYCGTNYCTYACYTRKDKDHLEYLLASWNEIDEKGFVVL